MLELGGGLGVLDLTTLGYALRLRWEWLSRMEPERLWVALPRKQEAIVQAMFRTSVTVQVGMGNAALFWRNRWLDGSAIADFAPDVSAAVSPRLRRARTVAGALVNMQWIRDDSGSLSTPGAVPICSLMGAHSRTAAYRQRRRPFRLEMDSHPAILGCLGL
jgi:hypothetical protein